MERLTKKNPGTNLERLLNFAIAKDKQVVLDYGFEKKPLVQVVVEKAKEIGCDASEQAVMWEGQCMECDCAVALMNMLAVQAAELHARLSKIEDILGDDYDLDRLAAIMNQRMSMREDVAERWKLTSDIPIDRLRELAQADREGRCVVLPCKVGDKAYVVDGGDYHSDYKPYVREKEVTEISWKKVRNGKDLGFGLILKGGDCNTSARYKISSIGKTVFLTREQAEKALKERKNNG